MPEAALDSWYRQDPTSAKQALTHLFETQNPLGYPVTLNVAKEQWQNRIDFWDRPIIPRSEVDLAPGAQIGPYTSKLAEMLGRAFPNQVSPRRVDAAVRGFFGGTVPDIFDALGLGSVKSTRETELADTPVIGKLWRRGGYYNAQSQPIADFWDIKQGIDARVAAMRSQIKNPDKPQTVPADTRDIGMSMLFDTNRPATEKHPASPGTIILNLLKVAAMTREGPERQRIYRDASKQARFMVDLYNRQQATLGK
jgi:hypothetical protein